MKIRIFTLAKELNMDSKLLIEYCQKLGIILKNSALASISPEEKERVLALIKEGASASLAPEKPEPMAPVREAPRQIPSKVPKVRDTTRAQMAGLRDADLAPPEAEDTVEEQPAPVLEVPGLVAEAPPEPVPTPVLPAAAPTRPREVGPRPETGMGVKPRPAAPEPAPVAALTRPVAAAPMRAIRDLAKPTKKRAEPAALASTAVATPPTASEEAVTEAADLAAETESEVEIEVEVEEPVASAVEEPPTVEAQETSPAEVVPDVRPVQDAPISAPATKSAPVAQGSTLQAAQSSGQAIAQASTITPPPTREVKPPAPMRREDYMSVTGSRAMVSRASPPSLGDPNRQKKPKAKPGPALPMLAELPPLPPVPTVKVVQETAQKPEMRFPKDIAAEKKPLTQHMKQHMQQRIVEAKAAGKKPGDMVEEFDEFGKKKKLPGGAVAGALADGRKRRQESRTKSTRGGDEDEGGGRSRFRRGRQKPGQKAVALKTSAELELPITVRTFCEAIGRPAKLVVGSLMRKGVMVTINSSLEEDVALELAMELGVDVEIKRERSIEDELEADEQDGENVAASRRAPIVTILGHVDHGKTTLLDKIRSANVAAGEVGGITQHIAAYQIEYEGEKITFLDTPGHAAFAEMRARGANVTDIAILVVAANDGVMPQTLEALAHARAANVPIVVAMNKSDLPERNEQRALQDLAQHNLLAAEWGGDTEVVRTSGLTGAGIEDLLATLLTIAELHELTANPERPARGVCLEAFRDEGRGPVAWLIIQDGTLRKGDVVLCGDAFGKIRGIYNDQDEEIDEAPPSMPVKVAGLDLVPGAGDKFYAMANLDEARQVAEERRQRDRQKELSEKVKPRTLQDILDEVQSGGVQELPVIIKADTPGSVEALKSEMLKFTHPEVRVRILHDGVGGVNESDVYLASASKAIIVAFHVIPEDRAQSLADQEGVEIRKYGIIYEVTDDIKKALEGLLKPEVIEVQTGRAVVLQTFEISRFGKIAGCRVLNGTIDRSNRIRVVRDLRTLNDYNIESLKRNKDDAKEVREGMECGIRLSHFDDVKEGDLFQAYRLEEIKRKL